MRRRKSNNNLYVMRINKKYFIGISSVLLLAVILILTKKIKINSLFVHEYKLHGIDASHYQGDIDWEQIQNQDVDFAFIKATEGSSLVDERFFDNWQMAGQTELFVGAYHFFSFDSDARTQAEFFIETVGNLSGKMPPVIDVEYYGDKWKNPPKKTEVVEQLRVMLCALEDEYQVKPIIYTTNKIYNRYLQEDFSEYPLWIRNVYYPPMRTIGRIWIFWQYTDTAVLDGYQGDEKYIDKNVFRGSKEELENMIVKL